MIAETVGILQAPEDLFIWEGCGKPNAVNQPTIFRLGSYNPKKMVILGMVNYWLHGFTTVFQMLCSIAVQVKSTQQPRKSQKLQLVDSLLCLIDIFPCVLHCRPSLQESMIRLEDSKKIMWLLLSQMMKWID